MVKGPDESTRANSSSRSGRELQNEARAEALLNRLRQEGSISLGQSFYAGRAKFGQNATRVNEQVEMLVNRDLAYFETRGLETYLVAKDGAL